MSEISMKTAKHFDYLVIGAGSGGVSSARRAASHGAKVGIIEKDREGGTCVIRGCVPKKIMTYLADLKRSEKLMADYGFEGEMPKLNFKTFVSKRNAEIDRLNGIYLSMLKSSEVDLIKGHALFKDEHTVTVKHEDGSETHYSADKIMIATGGKPVKAPLSGAEHCMTSDDMWSLTEIPKSLTIIGAGFIGVEFACIMQALGSQVNLVYRADHILRGFDNEMVQHLEERMKEQGIKLYPCTSPEKIEKSANALKVHSNTGIIESSHILMATGRTPNTADLGLENIGIETERGFIPVNDKRETKHNHIFAVGDVINHYALTPIAIRDGRAIADHHFGGKPLKIGFTALPAAVFSEPQFGTVGLTEEQARAEHGDNVEIKTTTFKPMKYSFTEVKPLISMKMVLKKDDQTVIGCHMVGADAAEIIQAAGVAIGMNAKMSDFYNTVALHPSSAEELVLM
jgi:glutathione reductase (NADPH)